MLQIKGYSKRWRKCIKVCVSNVQYFIIINGKPHGRINSTRGVRQANPISPFIFVITMNYISILLNHLEKRKVISGIILNETCSFNHLLFANDILVFIEDDDTSLTNLQMALRLFESAFGLKLMLQSPQLVLLMLL